MSIKQDGNSVPQKTQSHAERDDAISVDQIGDNGVPQQTQAHTERDNTTTVDQIGDNGRPQKTQSTPGEITGCVEKG